MQDGEGVGGKKAKRPKKSGTAVAGHTQASRGGQNGSGAAAAFVSAASLPR